MFKSKKKNSYLLKENAKLNYAYFEKGKIYRGDYVAYSGVPKITYYAEKYPEDWQEVK